MKNRPLLTLLTDFGTTGYHLGRLRGALLSAHRQLDLVDISHDVPSYDIVAAAHLLRQTHGHFPAGTIHLISVNDFYQPRGRFLALQVNKQFFIGPDNGLFSLVFDTLPKEIYVLDRVREDDTLYRTYARAVAHVAQDKPFYEIGLPTVDIMRRLAFQPVIGPDLIRGTVTYVDKFENVTTNITRELFERVGEGRSFHLLFKRQPPIDGLSFRYHDVPEGEPLCRFNSDGYLEISINMGKAAGLLGLTIDDSVQVEFG